MCIDNAGELKQLFKEKERRKSGAGGDASRTSELSEGSHPAGEAVPFWVDEESGSENGGMELGNALEGSEDEVEESQETKAKAKDRGSEGVASFPGSPLQSNEQFSVHGRNLGMRLVRERF